MTESNLSVDTTTAPVTTDAPAQPSGVPANFLDTLPESYRGEKCMQDYKDMESFCKSHVNLQQLTGSSIRIPTNDAGVEDLAKFYEKLESVDGVVRLPKEDDVEAVNKLYSKLGRPEALDNYDIGEIGDAADEEALAGYKKVAFDLGLSQKQFKSVLDYQMGLYPDESQIEAQMMADKESCSEALKSSWGKDYDTRIKDATTVLNQFEEGHKEALDQLKSASGNNPVLAMILSELAVSYKEKGTIDKVSSFDNVMTPAEAKQRIAEKMSNSEFKAAYLDRRSQGHAQAVKDMASLHIHAAG